MGDRALRLPKLDLPKPQRWDYVALALFVAAVALTGANLAAAGGPAVGGVSGAATAGFVIGQLAVCSASLMALGKTAKQGTLWGNLFAVAGMLLGVSGVLLAAAVWATA
jgi:hypothetical protein